MLWNNFWFWSSVFVLGIAFCIYFFRHQKTKQDALHRLNEDSEKERKEGLQSPTGPFFLFPKIIVPLISGTGMTLVIFFVVGLSLVFALTLGLVVAIISFLIVDHFANRHMNALEIQLADSVDLMVSSLRAGAGVLDAMENAVRESRLPLKPYLEEMLVRIRYGEDPKQVLSDLGKQVPLESFQLFSLSQTVQWEVGGSLASTLASVGNFIRNRVEIRRRFQTQTTQTRVSIIAVVSVSYFIGLVLWRTDPSRMESFLRTTWGTNATALAILLQAVGLIWASRLSRIHF